MKIYRKNNEKPVSKVFQDVFDKYDLMNDLMSFGVHRLWKKNFIHFCSIIQFKEAEPSKIVIN